MHEYSSRQEPENTIEQSADEALQQLIPESAKIALNNPQQKPSVTAIRDSNTAGKNQPLRTVCSCIIPNRLPKTFITG